LNAGALTAVVALAESDKEPTKEAARETFAQLFGSGAMTFGRAAGSFSITDGVLTVPTVLLSDPESTVLANARVDLNTLAVNSDWVVRALNSGDQAAQPEVSLHFSGPIRDPQRQVDLAPLLNRLQSRYLQRQIEILEALEAARRQRAEEERATVAERRDADLGQGLPTAASLAAPQEPDSEPALELQPPKPEENASPLTPSMLSPVPLTQPDAVGVEIGADLPPPTNVPIDLTPEPATRRLRTPPPAAAPATPAPTFQAPRPIYRVLPNGTIVKIR
jgi:hypothetical protein